MMRRAFLSALLGIVALSGAELMIGESNAVLEELPTLTEVVASMDITPAPDLPEEELLRRQDLGPGFMGWFSYSGYWYSKLCPAGETFGADPTWGACCSNTNSCIWATACVGNDVIAFNGATGDCGLGVCDTVTLLNSRGVAATGIRSVIQCFDTSGFYDAPKTWYRETFALTTARPAPSPTTRIERTTNMAVETVTRKVTVTPTGGASNLRYGGGRGAVWLCAVPLVAGFVGVLLI